MLSISAAQKDQTRKTPIESVNPPSGSELYTLHCATCHGSVLKGNGPFPAPYRVPPDLTTLAERHGGKFPDAYVRKVLRNGVTMPAHGPAEMPLWGTEFAVSDRLQQNQVTARLKNLSEYIKSFQTKADRN